MTKKFQRCVTISLMDATYKTTRYELALFFVAAKTNVGYTAVADYVKRPKIGTLG